MAISFQGDDINSQKSFSKLVPEKYVYDCTRRLINKGLIEVATKTIGICIRWHPSNKRLLIFYAELVEQSGNIALALKIYLRLIDVDQSLWRGYAKAMHLSVKLGDIETLYHYAELGPLWVKNMNYFYFGVISSLCILEKYDEAATLFEAKCK